MTPPKHARTNRTWFRLVPGFALAALAAGSSLSMAGCKKAEPPDFTFYTDRVAPVLEVGCVAQTTGCHVATPAQTAAGNLDLTSFDALSKRRDVLPSTGPYSVGQLLLKGGDPIQIPVQTYDPPVGGDPGQTFVAITTDIRHAGGRTLSIGSSGYALLKSWIAQGADKDGAIVESLRESVGDCLPGAGAAPGFDVNAAPADADAFGRFGRDVQPVLARRCAGSSCHGTEVADFHLSCGNSEAELRWNFFVTLAHVSTTAAQSELLRRPLSKQRGGTFHEGGSIFANTEDPDFVTLRDFADYLVAEKPALLAPPAPSEGLRFFGNYVQPTLVKKGCMFGNCHSPSMFHDLRLRGGSTGVFSHIALERNYEMARAQLSLESEDPNQSRLIAKNLFPPTLGGHGLVHRGGALLEDFSGDANAAACDGIDVTSEVLDTVPAYCVLAQWHALERAEALANGQAQPAGDPQLLAWVERPTDVGDVRDFDSYRPGADLLFGTLTLDAAGRPSLSPGRSVLDACGLSAASADVRGPASAWDGAHVAFAARSSAAAPFRLYEIDRAGVTCAAIGAGAASATSGNGIAIHDFDPAYAPDGRLVFASTRGNVSGQGFAFDGPQRTPSQLAPNANLYVREASGVRQLTFLSNQELMPSFMGDGRLIFTTEKRAQDFFQLAARRMNLDGGDYHPLFAQRTSVGFETATEVVELANRNLALVASHPDAEHGAGTIAIVNRSIGPDQDDRDPADKVYQHALSFPKPGAFDGASGAFRSPAALPSEWLVVSCDPDARALSGAIDFDLCALLPSTGELITLTGVAGRSEIEATLVAPRVDRGVFASRKDEANANTYVDPGASDAEVHVLDFPLLATLIFQNTRTGRPIDPRIGGFDVLESLPPPPDATSFSAIAGGKVMTDAYGPLYVDNELLGHVPLQTDGSARFQIEGGHPIVLRMTDKLGTPLAFEPGGPFTGELVQREEMQFYPGERAQQGFKRSEFNGMCAGCHGSVSGFELDVAVNFDVLTSASLTEARAGGAINLRR